MGFFVCGTADLSEQLAGQDKRSAKASTLPSPRVANANLNWGEWRTTMARQRILTSESVSEGHPDKLADAISTPAISTLAQPQDSLIAREVRLWIAAFL
jgi:hypothetical protein